MTFSIYTYLLRWFISILVFGPALLEHSLLEAGFPSGCKIGDGFQMEQGSWNFLRRKGIIFFIADSSINLVNNEFQMERKAHPWFLTCNVDFNSLMFTNMQLKTVKLDNIYIRKQSQTETESKAVPVRICSFQCKREAYLC